MENDKKEIWLNEIIDSLRLCFDGNGFFAFHESDENKAANAFTGAVGGLGMEPEELH